MSYYSPIAYTYEADTHCISCTRRRFSDEPGASMKFTKDTDSNGIWCDLGSPTLDDEGNEIRALYCWEEWQEFDEGFLAENPTQYLTCGSCIEVIEEYTHEGGKNNV